MQYQQFWTFFVKKFSHRPLWVLMACLGVLGFYLGFWDKTFFKIWRLYNNQKALEQSILDLRSKNTLVEERLKKLSQSPFLEREARDRFNLVGERDIIFIFSNEPTEQDSTQKEGGGSSN